MLLLLVLVFMSSWQGIAILLLSHSRRCYGILERFKSIQNVCHETPGMVAKVFWVVARMFSVVARTYLAFATFTTYCYGDLECCTGIQNE